MAAPSTSYILKHAEFRLRHRCIERCGKRKSQHPTRLGWRDDAVIPQPRRRVIRVTFGFESGRAAVA